MITWSDIKFPPINLYTVPILSAAVATAGCSSFDMNKIRDQRGKQGCYVVAADYEGKYLSGAVDKRAVWCSENLPKDYFKIMKELMNDN